MSINQDDAFKTIRASYQNSDFKQTFPKSSATKDDDDEVNLGCGDNNMSTFNEDKMSIDSDQLLKNVKKKFTTVNQYGSDKSLDKPDSQIQSPDQNKESNDDVKIDLSQNNLFQEDVIDYSQSLNAKQKDEVELGDSF